MHAADDFETIRIRMKAIARDEGKPPICAFRWNVITDSGGT